MDITDSQAQEIIDNSNVESQDVTITLKAQQVKLILDVLNELPRKVSNDTFSSIVSQIKSVN